MEKVTYRELRKERPLESLCRWSFVGHFCLLMCPPFSIFFMKHHVKPNTITVIMILLGVLGGILFALPSTLSKIMAIVVYWLWFILDCSDGEVARHTKTFSAYGTQLDWVAHLVCHPLMVLACWISFQQAGLPHFYCYTILSILLAACELIRRQFIAFDTLLSASSNMGIKPTSTPPLHKWLVTQLLYFPNFVLLFPILYVVSSWLRWDDVIYIYMGWAAFSCLFVVRDIIRYTRFFHNN